MLLRSVEVDIEIFLKNEHFGKYIQISMNININKYQGMLRKMSLGRKNSLFFFHDHEKPIPEIYVTLV